MKPTNRLNTLLKGIVNAPGASLPWQRYGLIAILCVYLLLTLAQSLTLPIFEGPDEQRHYAYTRYLVNNHSLPPVYKQQDDDSSTYQVAQESGQPPLYYLLVALVTAPFPNADNVEAYVHANPFMTAYDTTGVANDNHNRYLHGPERYAPFEGLSLAVHVGRLVSVLLGLATVIGIYGAARAFSPAQPAVALLAAALVACQPVFVFLSSAITNDAALICFATLTTWVILRIAREGATTKRVVLGGLLAGLTVLSKFNGVWIAGVLWLAILAAQVIGARRTRTRLNLMPLLLSVAAWLLVAGWWFAHNALVAGDPFGLTIHAIGDQSPLRLGKSALVNLGLRLAELESSVWFASGWAALVPGPAWLYTTYRLLYGVGLLGVFGAALQAWRARPMHRLDGAATLQALCLVVCVVCAVLGGVYWMLIYMWSIGRLMFAALAGAAILAATGWAWWLQTLRRYWRLKVDPGWLAAPVFSLALLCGGAGGVLIAYTALDAQPGISSPAGPLAQTNLTFLEPGGQHVPVASIVAYEFLPQDIHPGGVLYGRICWKSTGYTQRSFPYSLQLVGEGDVRPGTRNSYHGLGLYPLNAWKPGEVFCDPTSVAVTGNVERPRAYRLLVSLFDDSQPTGPALPVVDGSGNTVYPVLARVRVAPAHPQSAPAATPTVLIGSFAGLIDAHIDLPLPSDGGNVLSLTLHWVARAATSVDAKVFVHVLDKMGAVVAQSDHQPDDGWFPTNDWQAGDVVDDHVQITLPAGLHVQDVRLGVGLYDAQSVQRLPAVDVSTGNRLPDDIVFVKELAQ